MIPFESGKRTTGRRIGSWVRMCATTEPPFHWIYSDWIGRIAMVQEELL